MQQALQAAQDIAARMNTLWDHSPLSQFNQLPTGVEGQLHPSLLEALRTAQRFYDETNRTFDVTLLPVLELYRHARQTGQAPTDVELERARASSTWEHIRILEHGAIKVEVLSARQGLDDAVPGVDLGGMAKGFAIDRACEALQEGGVKSGLIEIGGDMRCFGPSITGGPWSVGVPDPFDRASRGGGESGRLLATLKIRDKAVCISGSWQDSFVIDGQRYSSTVDPNDVTRRFADDGFAASVTVVAPTATQADIWATALTVDPALRHLLDSDRYPDIEAMIILPPAEKPVVLYTSNFEALYLDQPPAPAPQDQDGSRRERSAAPVAVLGGWSE
jgi:thiamine biosynthesis lipoprotein